MLTVQERDANNLAMVRLASQALQDGCPGWDVPLSRHAVTRGNDLSGTLQGAGGIGGLLARTANPQMLDASTHSQAHSYYHCDGNGNITAMVDTNGILVVKYNYDQSLSLYGMGRS